MKHCPECNSFFPDTEQFCELDGTQLVTVDDVPNSPPADRVRVVAYPKSSGSLLTIGALIGILIACLLVLVYFALSRKSAPQDSNTSSSTSSARQQEFPQPLQPAPPVTASPSPEASVEPSASPSVETPSPQSSPQLELSSSDPISTAPGAKEPVIIKLDSGLTIEAEEAWRTAEGIWYRKHGVVSLLDPSRIRAIEKKSPAAPSPTASTPTPSP